MEQHQEICPEMPKMPVQYMKKARELYPLDVVATTYYKDK